MLKTKCFLLVVLALFSVQLARGQMSMTASPPPPANANAPATLDCVASPSGTGCSSFVYNSSRIVADLQSLCSAVGMGYMPACSVWRACLTNSSSVGVPAMCESFSLLATICTYDMPGMGGCANYKTLCSSSSTVLQCQAYAGYSALPSTMTVNSQFKSACAESSSATCASCASVWAAGSSCTKSNLLELYSQFCHANPTNANCAVYNSMCAAHPSLYLCTNVAIAPYSDCGLNPSSSLCVGYTYPSELAIADANSLCAAMPYMPGCTVYRRCQATGFSAVTSATDSKACDPFDTLATICKHDTGMSMMTGCRRMYNTMCASGTFINQCSSFTGLAVLPTTAEANAFSKEICTEMTMDGCEQCTPDWAANRTYCLYPDLVSIYSQMCYEMPEMTQCGLWAEMCIQDPTLFLCNFNSGSGGYQAGPVMKMYFNTDLPFYLLWKSWTPRSGDKLAGAFFAMFFLTVLYELLQLLKLNVESYEQRLLAAIRAESLPLPAKSVIIVKAEDAARGGCGCDPEGSITLDSLRSAPAALAESAAAEEINLKFNTRPLGLHPQVAAALLDVSRMVLAFINTGIGYLLMLGVMCFNVTIFFAVITGFGVGALLFGRFKLRAGGAAACSNSEAMCH